MINKTSFSGGERVEVSFEVSNIGIFDSDEVVQLYVKSPSFSSSVPKKELKAFRRLHVEKGMTTSVKLSFDVDDLSFWDTNTNSRRLWSGTYEIQIGASSEDIRRTAEITINGEPYTGLDVTKPIPAAASWRYIGVVFQTTKDMQEYALLDDPESSITYENCRLNGETTVEVTASNPMTATEVVISGTNGIEYARIKIPQTGSLERFETFTESVNMPIGNFDLIFSAGGMLSLKSFKFYK